MLKFHAIMWVFMALFSFSQGVIMAGQADLLRESIEQEIMLKIVINADIKQLTMLPVNL